MRLQKARTSRQHKSVAIQFADNDCDRHKLSVFRQKTGIFFKRKLGLDLSFFRKATVFLTFETRLSKKDSVLE